MQQAEADRADTPSSGRGRGVRSQTECCGEAQRPDKLTGRWARRRRRRRSDGGKAAQRGEGSNGKAAQQLWSRRRTSTLCLESSEAESSRKMRMRSMTDRATAAKREDEDTIGSPSGNSYFLLSRPRPSDSPPKEAAPSIGPQAPVQDNSSSAGQPTEPRDFFRDAINASGIGYGMNDDNLADISPQQVKKVDILSLGLPRLTTAEKYTSLKKKRKEAQVLEGSRTKTEGSNPSPQVEDGYAHILDLIRVQMEISESMDALTKRALRHISLKTAKETLDVPRISLQLLSSVGKLDFPTERLRGQWQKRQANVLEELLLFSASLEYDMSKTLRIVLSKLKSTEDWVVSVPEGRVEVLTIIERYNAKLCALTKKFDIKDETYHWTHNYHFNFRLYEKLLCSVFDILEDGQLVEEADEILETAKLTWPILGITEKLHHIFYAWVLFKKNNYSIFEATLNLVLLLVTNSTEDDFEEIRFIESPVGSTPESKLIHLLIVRSIHAAYKQALISSDGRSDSEFKHPLTILANELKAVAEKECTDFSPILHKYYPEAQRVALIFLHMLYGKQLELFFERTDHLENSKEILAASNNFELFIAQKLYTVYGQAVGSSFSNYLKPYMVGRFSSPLILQWLHAQHENVLEWTKRTIEIEDWTPLSSHEKQARSVVEVFRIVEETVDQFFNASLPLEIVHLRSLLIGITSSLEVYLLHMENQQVSGSTLLPSAPVLTRYAESMNPFAKRKLIEPMVPEEKVAMKLNNLTVPKLCVKLNTLQFIRDQLDAIEEGIKQSWVSVLSAVRLLDYLSSMASGRALSENLTSSDESVDELFTIFDDVRMTAVNTTDTILNFIGTRAVFWDMHDSFIFSLYRDSVKGARMQIFIPTIDQVLDQVCDLIVDVLRDQVVLRIFQACMAHPCIFETDVDLMQQDLAILKDLFIAEGQGLPMDIVEKEARQTQQILDLYMLKADTIIDMLINASDQTPHNPEPTNARRRHVHDANTLLRVLCHKKDKIASTFLRIQYHLPRSSDYDDVPVKDVSSSTYLFRHAEKRLHIVQYNFPKGHNGAHSNGGPGRIHEVCLQSFIWRVLVSKIPLPFRCKYRTGGFILPGPCPQLDQILSDVQVCSSRGFGTMVLVCYIFGNPIDFAIRKSGSSMTVY
ncbi:unnamed protein product [Miscanthus lutarioriparius]|uniref:MHD1 domain-containing protein n=1 Tax=Miscanthus lutarioriparius TaxID=422564 RepID=A0A811QLC0_9POAL|nr:unnamed protein product [Miscanthus lutarioriparius]